MAKISGMGFNKEKCAFLVCALLLGGALFWYLTNQVRALEDKKPISNEERPQPISGMLLVMKNSPDEYVSGTRRSPFTPKKDTLVALPKPKPNPGTLPIPPPPPTTQPAEKEKPKTFNPLDKEAEVDFMGVVMLEGRSYALVRPKDGSSPRRVKEGDLLPDYKYTITKIERQAIYLKDDENNPYVLKDGRFTTADASSGGSSESKTPAPKSSDLLPRPAPAPAPAPNLGPAPHPAPAPDHGKAARDKHERPAKKDKAQ